MYIALIADIKNSKKIKNRNEIQEELKTILNYINNEYNDCIESNLTITLGDEFQGLFNEASCLVEIIDYITNNLNVEIRFGIGVGEITTSINKEIAIGADGPAYYNAREAIETVKSNEKKHFIFPSNVRIKSGNDDYVINTLLSLMSSIRNKRTKSQTKIISVIKEGMTQMEIAKIVELDQSTIQRALIKGCYYEYKEASETLKKLLKKVGI